MAQSEVLRIVQKLSRTRRRNQILLVKNLKKRKKQTSPKNHTTELRKKSIPEAKLWWRRFIQYVKMTQDIDLNNMTVDKEILPEVRDELEVKIKNIFIWALGEAAVTEMTKTVRDND